MLLANTFEYIEASIIGQNYVEGNKVRISSHCHFQCLLAIGGFAYYIVVMVLEMVFGLFATMIAMWFSRYREFRADAGGARLAGRQKMIAALERLSLNHGQSTLPTQVAAFGIAGGIGEGLRKLFLSHPPLEQRIAALRAAGTTVA